MEDIIQYFQTKSHSEILDPFSCLIRISLLKHKQPNTKLCIYHNSLLYDEGVDKIPLLTKYPLLSVPHKVPNGLNI